MSHHELIESLRQRAEEKAREIRRQADQQVEQLRAEAAARLAEETALSANRLRRIAREEHAAVLTEAQRQARQISTEGANALAERLYLAARKALPELRANSPERLFAALAAELPDLDWEQIRVNPADETLARRQFPEVALTTDPEIAGGMEAVARQGRVRIDNTLGKRLERAWDTLLPGLLEDLAAKGGES